MHSFSLEENELVLSVIVESLSKFRDRRVLPMIIELLFKIDWDSEFYYEVIKVIIKFEPYATEILLEKLMNEDAEIRHTVIFALNDMKAKTAIKPIIEKALKDTDIDVRIAAINTLGEFRDPVATDSLRLLLSDKEYIDWAEETIGDRAARSLVKIGTSEAIEIVNSWKNSKLRDIRE